MDEQTLKRIFKYLNKFMVFMWRLGLGRFINFWPAGVGRIMVLTHTGRRSGLTRRTPVNYAIVEGELYCMAAFGQSTDWLKNIQSDPRVEIWLPQGYWAGKAYPMLESERRLLIIRQILINSGFAAPLFEGIYPGRLSEAELAQISQDYVLLQVRRTEALTGPGAMADLAWVWPAAAPGLLLAGWLRLCGRRRKWPGRTRIGFSGQRSNC